MSGCSPEGVHSPVRRAGSCQTKARRTRRNDSGSHPPPSRTHKAAAPETTAHPERTRSARTTQPQPPRSGAGGAVAGLSRAPIGRAFAGKQGDACLSERGERVCIAAPRTFAGSGSRRPRTSARHTPAPSRRRPARTPAHFSSRHTPTPTPHPTSPIFRTRHFPRRTRSISPDESSEAPPTSCSPPPCPHALRVT